MKGGQGRVLGRAKGEAAQAGTAVNLLEMTAIQVQAS